MNIIQDAINHLNAEIVTRQRIVEALQTILSARADGPVKVSKRGGKRVLTAAGREKIRQAVKRRWAKQKAAQKKAAK